MKQVNVALLGFGTVGSGAYELLRKNKELIQKRIGIHVAVKTVFVRRPEAYADHVLMPETRFTSNAEDILQDPDIDIVVEVMGGTLFAADCIERAMQAGKSVVTANKDLIALKGPELFNLAEQCRVDFRYEASVLGGIPIIRPLYDSLGGNQVTDMLGIMNGTTNYMLTKMTEEGMSYAEVLKEAQELGFAEADPTSDVEGYDAARKLAILSSIAFNEPFLFEDVDCQGITAISKEDIQEADAMGYRIKLIGHAKLMDKGHALAVYPMLIKKEHPLASVRGAYNAIYVKGDGIGDAMFYGQGAGSLPTGSSIVSDIMEIAKNVAAGTQGRRLQYFAPDKNIYDPGQVVYSYYFRIRVENRAGVLAKIASVLADNSISVRTVSQHIENDESAMLIIVTEPTERFHALDAITTLNQLDIVYQVENYLAVLA